MAASKQGINCLGCKTENTVPEKNLAKGNQITNYWNREDHDNTLTTQKKKKRKKSVGPDGAIKIYLLYDYWINQWMNQRGVCRAALGFARLC